MAFQGTILALGYNAFKVREAAPLAPAEDQPKQRLREAVACTPTIASLVAQVVASYGGREHEVHLPPKFGSGCSKIQYLNGQEQVATVLQCLTCKLPS